MTDSERLSRCDCCGRDMTVGRAAEKRAWRREVEREVPHPIPTVYQTNVCTCPPVGGAQVGYPQPCPVHAYLMNGTTTTNRVAVSAKSAGEHDRPKSPRSASETPRNGGTDHEEQGEHDRAHQVIYGTTT